MNKVKIKEMVSYSGHSLTGNGVVNLTLKAMYSELVNTIQVMQLLNNDITLKARLSSEVKNVGIFRVKHIEVDGDGESKIKLTGMAEYVNLSVLNEFPLKGDEVQEFAVMFISELEDEEKKTEIENEGEENG